MDESEPGLRLVGTLGSRREMLFSPCNALIRKLLLDAVWFVLELVETTLDGTVRSHPFRPKKKK